MGVKRNQEKLDRSFQYPLRNALLLTMNGDEIQYAAIRDHNIARNNRFDFKLR